MSNFSRLLEKVLIEELKQYQALKILIQEEHQALISLKSQEVVRISEERKLITAKVSDLRDKRNQLLVNFGLDPIRRLSDNIRENCTALEQKNLIPQVNKLKTLVEETRLRSKELGQVAGFSLNMIDGSLSILSSGKNQASEVYGRQGVIEHSYRSISTRDGGALREA